VGAEVGGEGVLVGGATVGVAVGGTCVAAGSGVAVAVGGKGVELGTLLGTVVGRIIGVTVGAGVGVGWPTQAARKIVKSSMARYVFIPYPFRHSPA
jgi:hypothetical protein